MTDGGGDQNLAARLQMQELGLHEQEQHDTEYAALSQAQEWQMQHQRQAEAQMQMMPQLSAPRPAGWCPGCDASQLPLHIRAEALSSALSWHSGVELFLCVLLLLFVASNRGLLLALAFTALLSPVAGLIAARMRDRRLALCHTALSAGVIALRAVAVPLSTANFLTASSSVALAIPSVHLCYLAASWFAFLLCDAALSTPRLRTAAAARTPCEMLQSTRPALCTLTASGATARQSVATHALLQQFPAEWSRGVLQWAL